MRSFALQKSARGISWVVAVFLTLASAPSLYALTPCPTPSPTYCYTSSYNCWTVNTSCHEGGDYDTNNLKCETGPGNNICTLRAAIQQANATANKDDLDRIKFDLGSGYSTIVVGADAPLPTITDPVIIDGQLPGATKIVLQGPISVAKSAGLVLQSPSEIYNLVFQHFSTAIQLAGSGGHTLQSNYIGTDATGTAIPPFNGYLKRNLRNDRGIYVTSPQNQIQNNVISANTEVGIFLEGASANNNTIQLNKIGTDKDGNFDLGNYQNGITLSQAPANNIFSNTISGNGQNGILLDGANANNNTIQLNKIGTNYLGNGALGNTQNGITLSQATENNILNNTISGNGQNGISITGSGATDNQIKGNHIGLNASGTAGLGNTLSGIVVQNASSTQIGGVNANEGNLISGNGQSGVLISGGGSYSTQILGNTIGTNKDGNAAIANSEYGIKIDGSSSNQIGGTGAGSGNLISGNTKSGIWLEGATTILNTIQGNTIGTDSDGSLDVGNGGNGIAIYKKSTEDTGPSQNTIGGDSEAARNLISGNNGDGVHLEGKDISTNRIVGNFIGTDRNGGAALANSGQGARLSANSDPNATSGLGPPLANEIGGIKGVTAGGSCTGECNLISGNGKNGVLLDGVGVTVNKLEGNFIGTDVTGKISIFNTEAGIRLAGAHSNTIGGYPEDDAGPNLRRNLISGNKGFGIEMMGALAKANQVYGNLIGTDVSGMEALGNGGGINLKTASGNKIGTNVPHAGNVISANQDSGVVIEEGQNNSIQSNQIGLAVDGVKALGNAGNGVHIKGTSTSNSIGGQFTGLGNQIAFNQKNGVMVSGLYNNEILENSIHDNQELGIDLDPVGVTPNDATDSDLGVNLLQNFPTLQAVTTPDGSGKIGIKAYLEGLPQENYRIEFFSNQNCDPSENGEGELFLGNYPVQADAEGRVVFTVMVPYQGGPNISATATDSSKNTSEFSPCRMIGTGFAADPDQDQVLDDVDNCPNTANPDQADSDGDRKGNACDVCPNEFDHSDYNNDGIPDCSQTSIVGGGCSLARQETSGSIMFWVLMIIVGASWMFAREFGRGGPCVRPNGDKL